MSDKLIVYAGLDERECDSYHVCISSIYKHALKPENIIVLPLYKQELINNGSYYRPEEVASTGFAFTRFLCPFLSNYKGWSLFIDGSDMLVTQPIENLFKLAWQEYAVMVVKHPQYTSSAEVKMDGQAQINYPRKNWSSVILFNNEHPKCKDLHFYVNGSKSWNIDKDGPQFNLKIDNNHKSGAFLHRFEWLENSEIGELPVDWNYLVEEYKSKEEFEKEHNRMPSLLHFTLGTPIFSNRILDDYSDVWFAEYFNAFKKQHSNYINILEKIKS